MTFEIRFLDDAAIEAHLDDLATLLVDAVDGGASVGFLPPLRAEEARAYWRSLRPEVVSGRVHLATAWAEGRLAGAAQLVEARAANARHRAEIAKVLVLRTHRRRGVGGGLLRALELRARERKRSTLVLDTREGDPSESLYQSLGWAKAGSIPDYARSSEGRLAATAFYFKLLDPEQGGV